MNEPKLGIAGRLAKTFLRSKLTPLIVLASLALGVLAVMLTPREEEPQIVVPMVDLYVPYPGAGPKEVESQVTTPLEKRLWGISGVEYLYSTSLPNLSLITVRFKVNEPQEASLVKVHQELMANPELLPAGALKPVVRLLTIDDVPFLGLTLHGETSQLRSIAEALARELETVPDTAQVKVSGGARRVVRIEPDPERLRSLGLSLGELQPALQTAEAQLPAGALVDKNRRTTLEASGFLLEAKELNRLVVSVKNGRPIYLGDVARIVDGPEPEPAVVLYGDKVGFEPAVTVVLSKRTGANATALSELVLKKVEALRGNLIPRDLKLTVTRNYGETAGEKSNELIEHLLIATLSVIVLILLAMGWRSAVVVGTAVPVTLALTLLITYLFGYTLNRVTLFALIFSIGILVDDAIVVVENIHRHLHMDDSHQGGPPALTGSTSPLDPRCALGQSPRPQPPRSFARIVVEAVDEVGNPTILATFAVIAAILPMAFVRGLMGPYMRPIPVGASVAMLFSLVIAFVISPWAALKVFRKEAHLPDTDESGLHPASPENASPQHDPERELGMNPETAPDSWSTRLYRKVMHALLTQPKVRWAFFGGVVVLLAGAMSLVGLGVVKVKMLPFDNKSEFMVQLDLPAGTPKEDALAFGQSLARRLLQEPVVRDAQIYAGTPAPFTFVGMVRHSFLREESQMVDIQVNLVPKDDRKEQSHAIAVRLRPQLLKLPMPEGTRMKIVEIPPGPPVMDTLVAEIYGPSEAERERYAGETLKIFRSVDGVVDVDSTLNPTNPKLNLILDREKAALHGVAPAHVIQTLYAAGQGQTLGSFHVQRGSTQVPVILQLASGQRQRLESILQLAVPGLNGSVPLSELVTVKEGRENAAIFHKNLMPVSYVFGDLAGAIESPVYALSALNKKLDTIPGSAGQKVVRLGLAHPENTENLVMKWDGEWHITLEVFRDLGIAFAAVLVLIFVLVVGWFESFEIPFVILVPVPLSLIGIIPAHGLLGAFFTATSMIGFIAGAGIIVRNSIILVDFIELKLKEGMALEAAVEEAGVVRFRPMLLTASAVLVGSAVMLADPIFQGLAISLMAGEVAATLLSRLAVPVLYYLVARRGHAAELQRQALVSHDAPMI